MKPGLPWSIKGIEPDAREAAKQAARRSGMTLGEWLNSRILDESDETSAPMAARSLPQHRDKPAASTLERTANRLEDIAEQLARLSQRDQGITSRLGLQAAERDDTDPVAYHRVLGRVESNERQTVEAFTAVNEKLTVLGRQMTQAVKATSNTRPEDSPSYQALEKAVRSIVEHMETSDKRNRDQMKSLQDRLATMAAKAQASPNDQILRQAPAFTQLESRLGELARRIDQGEQDRPQGLPDLLKQELTGLAERIDTVRETAEVLANRAQTQAVQASQQELRAIEARILGLIKEAQSSLTGSAVGPAEMQRLRGEIERLNRRIDEAQSRPSDNGDVLALRSAVEQLSTRVAQGPDMRPLADMDRRILDITSRLEQTQAATRSLPQYAELESRIAELDHRFNEVVAGQGSTQSAEIETRLAEVTDRVARTEQHLSSLETIERAVNQLFDSFEQQRSWTEQVAENAAARMAERLQAQGPQQVSLAGSPEIMALEQGLNAVRSAAETSDQRNQETLEAVHETLEQIVTKLAELESATIGQRVAAAAAPHMMMQEPGTNFAAGAVAGQPEMGNAETVFEAGPETQALNNPLEPSNGYAEVMLSNPFEATFNAIQPAGFDSMTASPAASDDFIAAARRAAQASAAGKSILSNIAPGAARLSENGSKKLLGTFFRKKSSKKDAGPATGLSGEIKPPPGFAPANSNDAKRRKLLLMGLVLLAAVSAFTFNMMGRASKTKPPMTPAAIEQTMPDAKKQSAPVAVVPKTSVTKAAPALPTTLEQSLGGLATDPITTSSIAPTNDSVAALVSGEVAPAENLPPAEVGTMKLREAAALGNASAQFVIATRYHNGDHVKQDFAKAAYWYGKAAAQGSGPAQYRVATLYEKGKGVPRDLRAALGWYERAAALGNVKAMHNAAVLSAGNEIGAPDYVKAFKWFSLGAAHGLKDSQYNLAVLLERGLGTEKNSKDAMFWYSLAAQQDDADALKRANELAKALPQAERLLVQQKLATWKPEVAPEAANVIAVNNRDWTPPQG